MDIGSDRARVVTGGAMIAGGTSVFVGGSALAFHRQQQRAEAMATVASIADVPLPQLTHEDTFVADCEQATYRAITRDIDITHGVRTMGRSSGRLGLGIALAGASLVATGAARLASGLDRSLDLAR